MVCDRCGAEDEQPGATILDLFRLWQQIGARIQKMKPSEPFTLLCPECSAKPVAPGMVRVNGHGEVKKPDEN